MEESKKYLYGAAVQGIQSFIFQTNELKDIVGASELVNQICTTEFQNLLGKSFSKEDAILLAAGNIKYLFDNEDLCKKVVLEFPRKIMQLAPGITISQVVVPCEGEYKDYSNELEKKLRVQRNKKSRSLTIGFTAIARNSKTGLPAVSKKNEILLDKGTIAKQKRINVHELCKKAFGEDLSVDRLAVNIDDITNKNNWIAVIHADGNGLGQIVQTICTDKKKSRDFSEALKRVTESSAQHAYKAVEDKTKDQKKIPIRPVVLGGDDLTVICRADIAIPYVKAFLEKFEELTKETNTEFGQFVKEANLKKLTACAGIAFIKSSYPFYYGYQLAEELCKKAKKDARDNYLENNLAPSCLMFHKIQDSFVESYDSIVERELEPNKYVTFQYGPYYLTDKKDRWTIKALTDKVNILSDSSSNKEGNANAVKSHLRQWMSKLHSNGEAAKQIIDRLNMIAHPSFLKELELDEITKIDTREKKEDKSSSIVEKPNKTRIPVYDILSLLSVTNQITKE